MAIIDLKKISKHYSAQNILDEIDFHIDEGERVVIIGKNGSGKSTLMKITNGSLLPDSGERLTQNNIEIKMLAQKPEFDPQHTVKEAIEAGLKEINKAKRRYDELSVKLADDFENKTLLREHEKISKYIPIDTLVQYLIAALVLFIFYKKIMRKHGSWQITF